MHVTILLIIIMCIVSVISNMVAHPFRTIVNIVIAIVGGIVLLRFLLSYFGLTMDQIQPFIDAVKEVIITPPTKTTLF